MSWLVWHRRASASAEEQEDRALLALEASVYANGCGSGWQSKVVPQWNMTPACNKHDNCYGNCRGSKVACDNTMLADICKSKHSKTQKITKTICEGQAVLCTDHTHTQASNWARQVLDVAHVGDVA